jgi:hypothetical protein
VEKKLAKEISQGRIAGPFHELPFVNMHMSPIGVVPKKEVGDSLFRNVPLVFRLYQAPL